MNDLFIHRSTESIRKPVITLKSRLCSQFIDLSDRNLFEIHRRGSGNNMRSHRIMYLPENLPGGSHLLDLLGRLDHDGHRYCLPRSRRRRSASVIPAVTSSTDRLPSTSSNRP